MEQFNPHQYEKELANLEPKGPFKLWSGKSNWERKQQFPPQWGHPSDEIVSIYRAIYKWFEMAENGHVTVAENYFEQPYLVDANGEVIISMASVTDVAFLVWLSKPLESGGTVGLLHRHGLK